MSGIIDNCLVVRLSQVLYNKRCYIESYQGEIPMNPVRVRFAPSPTGHLHIGGARTALFNYLFAKRHGGTFILRIEDTDLARSSYESERVIIDDLHWLGITWDEGVDAGGPHGPYRSTERTHIYKPYIDKLLREGKAYHCYCTPEELEEQRKQLEARGEMPRYMGNCRNLTDERKKALEAEGRKPAIRFRVPENRRIVVNDLVRGEVEFDSSGIGDFIIVKSDGIPVYNFAVVVDDHLMEITHVIRGEEHLSNTPNQILIYDALGFEKPEFAHVSLILGKDRKKMSKRHGSTWVEQYRDAGYLPEAVVNYLVLLGWSSKTEQEIFSMAELETLFSLEAVSKNPAVFDIDKLNWLNAQYIKNTPTEKIAELAVPYLKKAGFIGDDMDGSRSEWLKAVVKTVQDELSYVGEIADKVTVFLDDKVEPENEEAAAVLKEPHVPGLLEIFTRKVGEAEKIDEDFARSVFKEIQSESGIKGKSLFMPIRVALTGKTHGPEMVEIIPILGREGIMKRLRKQ